MLKSVIAKYNENVSWIEEFQEKHFIIYNKWTENYKPETYENVSLKNIWREADTYLSYIIDNYSSLPEQVLFLQWKVLDHITEHQLSRLYNERDYTGFFKHYYVPNFRIQGWAWNIKQNKSDISLHEWAKKYIDNSIESFIAEQWYYVSYWAIFKIDKQNILSRPKEFYEILKKTLHDINPEEWHFLERLWYYVFNYHKKDILDKPDFIIVGSGLSWSVISEQLSKIQHNYKILIIEKRNHVWGNCYDYVDEQTGIRVSKYGAHIFHTNNETVWEYVNKFSSWIPYKHKVYWKYEQDLFPIPLNIKTVNILCWTNIKNEGEMKKYLDTVRDTTIQTPSNGEEYFLSKIWKNLYEKIIKQYTEKQWDKSPKEIDISVFKRIKICYDFSEWYFSDKHQALPKNWYTQFINNIISAKNIQVLYWTDFNQYKQQYKERIGGCKHIYYSWPIDVYFSQSWFPGLEYRSIKFDFELLKNTKFFQSNSVINYTSSNEKYTRIVEYKHFYENNSKDTIISREYSSNKWDPYYPVPSEKNISLYNKYKVLSDQDKEITFLWRLWSYKYYNMDEAISSALEIFNESRNEYE